MIRKIIKIDSEKCNGCGLCVDACHEDAIGMIDGKATLLRDDYCDGLGDCLPVCPTGAISFEEREALSYNEAEVKRNMAAKKAGAFTGGCPGSNARALQREENNSQNTVQANAVSRLSQWPVQIKLVPVNAPYFENADLLICADCAAYAYANMHEKFIKGRITLIGCPKLDDGDYSEKLTEILRQNNINSVTIVRMEVPCCGGLEYAVKTAVKNSQTKAPLDVVTVSIQGGLI